MARNAILSPGYLLTNPRVPIFRLPAAIFLFRGAFQPQERISGAFLQSAAEQGAREPTSQTVWESKIAMVADATSPVHKRSAVHRLVNRHAKRQPPFYLKFVMLLVDECVFEGDTKMQPTWARLTDHALALGSRPRRFHASDANVKETAPARKVGEQPPYDADRRLDNLSGAG